MSYSTVNLTRTALYLLVCLLLLVAARANAQETAGACQPYQPFTLVFEEMQSRELPGDLHYSTDGACYGSDARSIDGERDTAVGSVRRPKEFTHEGNYPNPFNPTTNIVFNLPASAQVTVQVFDMLGRRVMELPVRRMSAGTERSVRVDASHLSSGTYLYRLVVETRTNRRVKTGRMTLLK